MILRLQRVAQDSKSRLSVYVSCVAGHRHCDKANNKGQFLNASLQFLKFWHLVHMYSLRILLWLDLELLLLQVVAERRKGPFPPCPQEVLPLLNKSHWPVNVHKVMYFAKLKSTVSYSPSLCIVCFLLAVQNATGFVTIYF